MKKILIMADKKVKPTVSEQIDKAKDGRTQRWIIQKLNEAGFQMNDVTFSNKKNGVTFTEDELKALSEILGTEITA